MGLCAQSGLESPGVKAVVPDPIGCALWCSGLGLCRLSAPGKENDDVQIFNMFMGLITRPVADCMTQPTMPEGVSHRKFADHSFRTLPLIRSLA